jgi:predicted NAD/FAD-dependent oxidoreductase
MIRRFFYFLLAICTAGLLVFVFDQPQSAQALHTCMANGKLVAQVNNPQPQITGDRPMRSFELLEMPGDWQKLVGTDIDGKCFDYIERKTSHVTLTAFMPVNLATDLTAQRWSKKSPKAIQAMISASTHYSNSWLSPEDALAFHRLGYEIPNTAKVLTALNSYRFDLSQK